MIPLVEPYSGVLELDGRLDVLVLLSDKSVFSGPRLCAVTRDIRSSTFAGTGLTRTRLAVM